ncbi:centromere-associated protein E [Suncus etruscus]|uniref:centromere-associated protein E n=1 Tax=Suncus etruscus TaxID=109475 RepID=UPI00211089D0|nr:centromere-associated protein E [Suncus etruscus]
MAEESAVAVCVRVRPLNSREEALGENSQVYWKTGDNAIYQVDGSKSFGFDRVFSFEESTKNVYEEIAMPIINSAIQGYNGTIFAYGQTASGKTYTMMGSKDNLGVIPRAIHDIFQKIQKFPDREFLLRVSYMEIYNETITDLLCDTQKMKPLIIREDYNRNVYVSDLMEEVVYTSDMALKWITKGEKNRHYGITKMNQRSSRSHTIFRMILESREKGDPSSCEGAVKVSHLNLVDLAGSERAAQTGAEGMRLKEGCNINRSLFILGQVIKKLSDEQAGGFINYRDSKLTRILQNSLGGNAKTRIICTVTPMSYDETLSTLQFASTAKYMKNTPYVNEVSSDEALLKRYRKEIMDLKKQLEEVSLETRAQAMEKDQLAQLLEEKDLLQKVQIEKIQNLTRMLVTSSSLSSQQELKAKKRRRVTWCLGKINKVENAKFTEEFSLPASVTTKTNHSALGFVGEMDKSLCSEADPFYSTLDVLEEIEWNPASKLLASDNSESQLRSLCADYDHLVLDYERLRRENEEMEIKLKEKKDLDEFEALERKAEKDQEMQLIHEISNLKNLVKHAEAYNQDLENELSSKAEQLREKEDQIKQLQKQLDTQKSENFIVDLSYSSEPTGDLKQLRQSLLDAETVAMDSKRESAFLKDENRKLCEKLKEQASMCGQIESDLQGCQRQLEAKKKMQADMEKELQAAFSEITELNALLNSKVPKDTLTTLALERKISELQKELKKELEEKEALHNEVNLLTELKSLPSEVEILRKEILEKSEALSLVTSEKDKLLSELLAKDNRAQDFVGEVEETRDATAAGAQMDCLSSSGEMPASKHCSAEDQYQALLEENCRRGEELTELHLRLAALEMELTQKAQELQQQMAEGQAQQDNTQQLQVQLQSQESRLQDAEQDRARLAEQLEQALRNVSILTQEKDALWELQASLQMERNQLQCDIQDTVTMNIETQEQLREALESLRQNQETISSLRRRLAAEPNRNSVGELSSREDQPLEASAVAVVEDQEPERKIFSLIREKEELQQMLEHMRAEKEQLRSDLQESIERTIENQDELRILREKFKSQQEMVSQGSDPSVERERLASTEERLREMSQRLCKKEEQLVCAQEELGAAQSHGCRVEKLAPKLQESLTEVDTTSGDRCSQWLLQEALEAGQEQLHKHIGQLEAAAEMSQEEQRAAHRTPAEQQEMHTAELVAPGRDLAWDPSDSIQDATSVQGVLEDLEPWSQPPQNPAAPVQANSELELRGQANHQEIESLVEERDQLRRERDMLAVKHYQLRQDLSQRGTQSPEAQRKQDQPVSGPENSNGQETVVEIQPWAGGDRDTVHSLREPPELDEHMRKILTKHQKAEEELTATRCHLQAQEETIKELRAALQDREIEAARMQQELNKAREELQKQFQELEQKREQRGENGKREAPGKAGELSHLRELVAAQDTTLQSTDQEQLEAVRTEQALLSVENGLAESVRATETKLEWEHSAGQEDVEPTRQQLGIQQAAPTSMTMEDTGLAQGHLEQMTTVSGRGGSMRADGHVLRVSIQAPEQQELKAAREHLKGQQEELKAAREHLKGQQEELEAAREHLKGQQEELEAAQEHLKGQQEELEAAQEHLKGQQEELEAAQAHLKGQQEELEAAREHLKEQQKQLEAAQEHLKGQQEELEAAREHLKEQQKQLEAAQEHLKGQQEELEAAQGHLKGKQETLESLRKLLSEQSGELTSVRAELETSCAALRSQAQERQKELEAACEHLKEQQEAVESLKTLLSEQSGELANVRAELETSNTRLQEKTQELRASEHQLCQLWEDVSEMEKQLLEMKQLRKQLKEQGLSFNKLELENLNLAQQLHENLQDTKALTKERDELRLDRDQLQERLQASTTRHLEIEQELGATQARLKAHQETIQKLGQKVSEKSSQISDIQEDFEKSEDELQRKIQDLQKNQLQLLKMKEHVDRTHKTVNAVQQLMRHSEAPGMALPSVEMENLLLTQRLHDSQEELRAIAQERDELRRMKENLEADRARVSWVQREGRTRDLQDHRQGSGCDRQPLTRCLREKCSRIKELLRKYSEMNAHYESLNSLSTELERDVKAQKELSVRVKEKLALPFAHAKEVDRVLMVSLRCSSELLRIMKKMKYVLSNITKIKEEQHKAINRFETAFIDEVEKQHALRARIQHLQLGTEEPSRDASDMKLSQNMDLHLEEILRDLSESDFHSMKAEFEEMLRNRKETLQLLQDWLTIRFDTEKLKDSIQSASHRISQGNNFYNKKILEILNESTEFEERSATLTRQWERDLRAMREKREALNENYQALLHAPLPSGPPNPASPHNPTEDRQPLIPAKAAPHSSQASVRELEALLREAREHGQHKDSQITKMQKDMEASQGAMARLQEQVSKLSEHLEKEKAAVQELQDKVALGAKPYKEKIEELKTKLVRRDLEEQRRREERDKELVLTSATVEYQKEVIRSLKETLRKNQQAQDTSMASEHTDPQPPSKPLTCGGGSGIVQSTKALILKSECTRLEKENCQLRQQNEQLTQQKNELLSNNQHLCSEVHAWKERTLQEAQKDRVHQRSPKSPKVTALKKHPRAPTPSPTHLWERNAGHPKPPRSPRPRLLDNHSRSLPSPQPTRYFDNSSLCLGLDAGPFSDNGVDSDKGVDRANPKPLPWMAESSADVPECKTQ